MNLHDLFRRFQDIVVLSRAVNWLLWPVKFKLAALAASTSIVLQLIGFAD